MEYLTIREFAERFKLNPQTVYRKCKRNEIDFIRIGQSLRVPVEASWSFKSFKLSKNIRKEKAVELSSTKIPQFIERLFWDSDVATLKVSDQIVRERILELGDLKDIAWLFSTNPHDELVQYILSTGKRRLSDKSLNFWKLILGVIDETDNTAKSSTKALGETVWR